MKIIVFLFLWIATPIVAQDLKPFMIYNAKGKRVSTKVFLKELEKREIILFGELHNNPISHWMELKIAEYISANNDLILGAEMLKSDEQFLLNQYLKNEISQQQLDSCIQLWPNYKTDYKPLVDFAKDNQLEFIATNTPQKYATKVYREGLDQLEKNLPEEEKEWLPPLPIAYNPQLPGYKAILTMFGEDTTHVNTNLPKAQAIKDATMAYFIHKNWKKKDNNIFLHFNGDYHSKNFEGIYWYLKNIDASLDVVTISTVEQKNIQKLAKEHEGTANFIIVVDVDMTKTY